MGKKELKCKIFTQKKSNYNMCFLNLGGQWYLIEQKLRSDAWEPKNPFQKINRQNRMLKRIEQKEIIKAKKN